MTCPRCGGFARGVRLVTAEEDIEAESCINCGWIGGESLIDHHHNLTEPPDPRPDVLTPTYDPERRRLLAAIATHLNNLD